MGFTPSSSKIYLVFLERRGKVKDEGSKRANSGNGDEESTIVSVGGGDEVGVGDDGLHDGSIDQHVGCRGGAGARGNSLVDGGREGGSGSNEEGEKEEGTHLGNCY
eukprot:162182_1